MEFIRKDIRTKENELVKVYVPTYVPEQLRVMDATAYNRVILGNAEGYGFLRDVFLIAGATEEKNVLFYIPDHSRKGERYQEWFDIATLNMDMVIFNYHCFQAKPKEIKRIIEKSKSITGQIEQLAIKADISKEIPHWEYGSTLNFKTFSKYVIVSANRNGFIELAQEADDYTRYEDEETYQCDGHAHIGGCEYRDRVATDFWYYYESKNSNMNDKDSTQI